MIPLKKHTLILILTVIAGIWFVDWAAPVGVPVVSALFLIAVFWPLQRKLQKPLGRGWAAVMSFLAMAIVLVLFAGGIVLTADHALEVWQQSYHDTFMQQFERFRSQSPAGIELPESQSSLQGYAKTLGQNAVQNISLLLLTLALAVLGLAEVGDSRDNLKKELGDGWAGRWLSIGRRGAREFRLYVLVRTGIGLLNGVIVWLFCWALGLDLALTWGVLSFLLNYIPTIGSVVAVIPPALFALVQFGLDPKALGIAVGIAAIQLVLGNYVDPLLQGRYLELSNTVVLVAITFWGWLWGPIGALLGVPITLFLVIVLDEFRETRWLSVLLTRGRRRKDQDGEHAGG